MIYSNLFEKLSLVHRQYYDKLNQTLNEHHLTGAQWFTLKIIAAKKETTLVEIARLREIEKPTATKIIHRLLELNYIQAVPGKDRREKKLTLTNSGKAVYHSFLSTVETLQTAMLQNLTEEQITSFEQTLTILQHNILEGKDVNYGNNIPSK